MRGAEGERVEPAGEVEAAGGLQEVLDHPKEIC
jgi:hypothetical protein